MPRSGGKRGSEVEMQEWTPGGDPILALLPPEPPWAFQMLPRDEQQWRARVFLAVWIQTDGTMFAWSQALTKDPDDAAIKAWVLKNLTYDVILDGLQSRQQPEAKPLA